MEGPLQRRAAKEKQLCRKVGETRGLEAAFVFVVYVSGLLKLPWNRPQSPLLHPELLSAQWQQFTVSLQRGSKCPCLTM